MLQQIRACLRLTDLTAAATWLARYLTNPSERAHRRAAPIGATPEIQPRRWEHARVAHEVGVLLKAARGAAGLSMRELGERTGIDVSSLYRAEKGEVLPSRGRLRLIAIVLEIDPTPLLELRGRAAWSRD